MWLKSDPPAKKKTQSLYEHLMNYKIFTVKYLLSILILFSLTVLIAIKSNGINTSQKKGITGHYIHWKAYKTIEYWIVETL